MGLFASNELPHVKKYLHHDWMNRSLLGFGRKGESFTVNPAEHFILRTTTDWYS